MRQYWFVGKSKIEGIGVFAQKDFVANEPIEVVLKRNARNGSWFITPNFGSLINHSAKFTNARLKLLSDNQYWLVTTAVVRKNEEFLADYNDPRNPPMVRRVDFTPNRKY